jgi:hypothetical protein
MGRNMLDRSSIVKRGEYTNGRPFPERPNVGENGLLRVCFPASLGGLLGDTRPLSRAKGRRSGFPAFEAATAAQGDSGRVLPVTLEGRHVLASGNGRDPVRELVGIQLLDT